MTRKERNTSKIRKKRKEEKKPQKTKKTNKKSMLVLDQDRSSAFAVFPGPPREVDTIERETGRERQKDRKDYVYVWGRRGRERWITGWRKSRKRGSYERNKEAKSRKRKLEVEQAISDELQGNRPKD